jgi:hypothetical protein
LQCYGQGVARYPKLFTQEDGEAKEVKPKNKMGFTEYWGWYLVYDSLSNNDPIRWEEIDKWTVTSFLNTIAFYRDKQKEHENQRLLNGTR